jgi:hypothetical protein
MRDATRGKKNITRSLASSAHGPGRPEYPSDLRLVIDSAPSLIHTSLPDGYLDFFNKLSHT